jgi:hypothetical protein
MTGERARATRGGGPLRSIEGGGEFGPGRERDFHWIYDGRCSAQDFTNEQAPERGLELALPYGFRVEVRSWVIMPRRFAGVHTINPRTQELRVEGRQGGKNLYR